MRRSILLNASELRAAGDAQSDLHLVNGKVCIKYGRSPPVQVERVRALVRFRKLKEQMYGEEIRRA